MLASLAISALAAFTACVAQPLGEFSAFTLANASAFSLNAPYGLILDATSPGRLFVVDDNQCILSVTHSAAAASVTVLAGVPNAGGFVDGASGDARFYYPLMLDQNPASGVLYVTDFGNNALRAVTLGGVVSTLAPMTAPWGIVFDASQQVCWVTLIVDCVIARVSIATGVVTTVAGGNSGGQVNGYINAVGFTAAFWFPAGLALNAASGSLYIAGVWGAHAAAGAGLCAPSPSLTHPTRAHPPADTGNYMVREMSTTTFAVAALTGGGSNVIGEGAQGSSDGVGADVLFFTPICLAWDALTGVLYIGDWEGAANFANNRVRALQTDGITVTTVVGGGATGIEYGFVDGVGTSALFNGPGGLALGPSGTLWVSDSANNAIRGVVNVSRVLPSPAPSASPTANAASSNASVTFSVGSSMRRSLMGVYSEETSATLLRVLAKVVAVPASEVFLTTAFAPTGSSLTFIITGRALMQSPLITALSIRTMMTRDAALRKLAGDFPIRLAFENGIDAALGFQSYEDLVAGMTLVDDKSRPLPTPRGPPSPRPRPSQAVQSSASDVGLALGLGVGLGIGGATVAFGAVLWIYTRQRHAKALTLRAAEGRAPV